MEITLIRHFATQGNLEKRYIGTTDEGISMEHVPENLGQYKAAEVLIASPLRRCVETARIIYGREPSICEAFRECDFGLFENKNYEELKENQLYQKWLASMGKEPFPGGESSEAFKERCRAGFLECVNRCIERGKENVTMVVHGGTIMAVMETYGIPERAFYDRQVKNGGGYLVSVCAEEWKRGIQKVTEEIKL